RARHQSRLQLECIRLRVRDPNGPPLAEAPTAPSSDPLRRRREPRLEADDDDPVAADLWRRQRDVRRAIPNDADASPALRAERAVGGGTQLPRRMVSRNDAL